MSKRWTSSKTTLIDLHRLAMSAVVDSNHGSKSLAKSLTLFDHSKTHGYLQD